MTDILLQISLKSILNSINFEKIFILITEKILILIGFTILFLIFRSLGKSLINHFFQKYRAKYSDTVAEKRINTFHTLTRNIFGYCVWFFYIYAILSTLGVPVGTLVASAGIFSLAIGLGAQGFVNDIVSGFFILLEKQIQVGEYVQINTIKGTVSAVGLRTTQIISDDGTLNFIPNRTILTISNMSRNNMIAMIQIIINADTPVDKITSCINTVNQENVKKYSDILAAPEIVGTLTRPDGQLVIQVDITTKNGAQAKIKHDFLSMYLKEISRQGIKLPKSPIILNSGK